MSGITNTIIASVRTGSIPGNFNGTYLVSSDYIESVTAGVTFENNGYISAFNSAMSGLQSVITDTISGDSWYLPNTTDIGNSYWIRATLTSGTQPAQSTGTFGSWTALSSGVSWQHTASGTNNTVSGTISISISSSSSGTPIVVSGNVTITADTGFGQVP